jgi:tetratricopeptide (TPR) repeat protein
MSGWRRRYRRLVGLALIGFVVTCGEPASGGRLTDFSQEELHTLPRLCLAQQFINEELASPVVPERERRRLSEKLGHSFIHYHHYCWALLYIHRAAAPGGDKFNYHRAVDNFDYVLRNADPSFTLLPEVYFQKGSLLEQLGDREAAASAYQNALRARADYTPARAALVQFYLDRGDVEAARTALEEGLKHDPRSKTLAEKKSALAARETKTR